jgi:hypothetical protein
MNYTYLGFRNAHFLHGSTDRLAANDDTIGKTHHGGFALVDVLDVSDKGMACESRDEPGEQKASRRMNVNNVWLKVAEITAKSNDSFHELQRTTCLVKREMLDLEAAQQRFMTSASGSDHHRMTLLDLSRSEVEGRIDDAVAEVRHVVRYVQDSHLHLRRVPIL